MATRVRNQMTICPPTVWDDITGKRVVYINTMSTPNIGEWQRISGSEDSGSFLPGKLRINPVVITSISKTYKAGVFEWLNGTPKCVCSGPFAAWQTSFFDGSLHSGLADQSITAAYSKIGKAVIDVGMTLAELPETLALVKGGFTRLDNMLGELEKSGGFSRLAGKVQDLLSDSSRKGYSFARQLKLLYSRSKSLGDFWLTWRYGIRPLVGEITQYIQAFNGKAGDLLQGSFVRSKAKKKTTSSSVGNPVMEPYGGPYVTSRMSTEAEVSSYSTIYFSLIRVGEFYNFFQRYGLAPHQMPKLAWELIPLSFMLDWFIDVGSWISAITPVPDAKILGSTTSQKIVTTQRRSYTSATYGGRPPSSAQWPEDEQITSTLRRVVGPPMSAMPSFNWGLTLQIQQYADLFTVALQRLKRR